VQLRYAMWLGLDNDWRSNTVLDGGERIGGVGEASLGIRHSFTA